MHVRSARSVSSLRIVLPFAAGALSLFAQSARPALPRAFVNTKYPAVTGRSIAVHAGGDLQSALNAANCGDEVVVDAGASFVGNFNAPAKGCTTTKILVRSSQISSLPAGVRVQNSQASLMPRIATPNTMSVLGFSAGASGYYFAGINFTVVTGVQGLWNLITLSANATSVSQLPQNIVFDRVLVHGNDQMCVRGFLADAAGFALTNSRVFDFIDNVQDTQAVMAYNSPGPYLIRNNYLEATGENIMFGGANPTIPGVVPSDATITRNWFHKLSSWQGNPAPCGGAGQQQCYDVKNMFEVKHGQRALLDSNVFDTTFDQGQGQFIIMNCPYTGYYVCQDLTFTNNLFQHGDALFVIAGNGVNTGQNILIQNNLAADITSFVAQASNTRNMAVDHNTVASNGGYSTWFGDPPPSTDLQYQYTNNIAYGPFGANASSPIMAFDALPYGSILTNDVFVGDTTPANLYPAADQIYPVVSTATPVTGQPACNQEYAPSPCIPLDWGLVGMIDYLGGSTAADLPGLALTSTSRFHNAASDGTDIGANVSVVLSKTAGVMR